MVYAVQAGLRFSSASRRDSIANAVETRIDGRPRWSVDSVERVDDGGEYLLLVSLRFISKADEADLYERIQTVTTGPNAPLPDSWIQIHDCRHDENVGACSVEARREW